MSTGLSVTLVLSGPHRAQIKKAGNPAFIKIPDDLTRLEGQCHAQHNNYSQKKRAIYHHSAQYHSELAVCFQYFLECFSGVHGVLL